MKIFISYAHGDEDQVRELVDILRDSGHDPWFDHQLVVGRAWEKQLLAAIKSCDRFLYALTPESAASPWCQWEFAQAVHKKKPVVPVLLQANTPLDGVLSRIQYADFSQDPTFSDVAKLLGGVAKAERLVRSEVPLLPPPHARPERPIQPDRAASKAGLWIVGVIALLIVIAVSVLLIVFGGGDGNSDEIDQTQVNQTLIAAREATTTPDTFELTASPFPTPAETPLPANVPTAIPEAVYPTVGRIMFTSDRDCHPEIESMSFDGTLQSLADFGWLVAWSPDGTKLAFSSAGDGDNEIYTMNADGSGLVQLTFNNVEDLAPAWSPDGSRIVFISARDGINNVYIMNADGSDPHKAFDHNAEGANDPVWSPDGTQLAYTAWHNGYSDIYVATLTTQELRRVTTGEFNEFWASWSPNGEQIAFAGWDDAVPGSDGSAGNFDIYVIAVDGTSQQPLTVDPGDDARPVWSPDGQRIAFETNRDGNYNLYTMTLDGENLRQITTAPVDERWASWHPGSSSESPSIAYHAYHTCGGEIYLLDLADGDTTRLTHNESNDWQPAWSPDEAQIAYASRTNTSSDADIYLINPDGSNPRNLTNAPGSPEWYPGWSPDGASIAFHSNRDGDWEIFVLSLSDHHLEQITTNDCQDFDPAWSPNGTQIAFKTDCEGNNEIFVANADGSQLVNVSQNPGDDWLASWSPDGTRIAYSSERGAGYDIYVTDLQTGESVQLTNHPARDVRPFWSPDGEWIVFVSNRDGQSDLYALQAATLAVVRLTDNPALDDWPYWGE